MATCFWHWAALQTYLQMDDVLPAEGLICQKVLPELRLHIELLDGLQPDLELRTGIGSDEGRVRGKNRPRIKFMRLQKV